MGNNLRRNIPTHPILDLRQTNQGQVPENKGFPEGGGIRISLGNYRRHGIGYREPRFGHLRRSVGSRPMEDPPTKERDSGLIDHSLTRSGLGYTTQRGYWVTPM